MLVFAEKKIYVPAVCVVLGTIEIGQGYERDEFGYSISGNYADYSFETAEAMYKVASNYDWVSRDGGKIRGLEYTFEMCKEDFERIYKEMKRRFFEKCNDFLTQYPLSKFRYEAQETGINVRSRLKDRFVGDVYHNWVIRDLETNKKVTTTPQICTSGEFSNIHTVQLHDADGNVIEEQTLELEF